MAGRSPAACGARSWTPRGTCSRSISGSRRRECVNEALEVVFLDVGGVLYPDEPYKFAVFRALRELGADVSARAYEDEYTACRRDQNGSFRYRLTKRFLGPDGDPGEVQRVASRYWSYPAGSLFDDVV